MALTSRTKQWLFAVLALLFFIIVALIVDLTLALEPVQRWVLWIGFVVLGLVTAGALLWYLRPRDENAIVDHGDDALLAIAAGRQRLPRGTFAGRSMVLVLGPTGATKTTIVTRSGASAELLAGDAGAPADGVASTRSVNLWLMQDAVIAEIAGSLLADVPRFTRIIRALRAPRVAAALGRGEIAPRAAVVCVPCDLFYEGGNGQQLELLAQTMRQRLADAARELGLRLPVYVVFTRLDRVPHFESWVAPLMKDELRAPLGESLVFDREADAGSYGDRLQPRLDSAFRTMVASLANRRVDLLTRESVTERRYNAYEFPREMRKLAPLATRFLLEICRPTQLSVSPQLRGFYFTGARPVIITDVAQARPVDAPPQRARAADATMVFQQGITPSVAPVAAPGGRIVRKVPEWVFLDRFFRDVVLADHGAASAARGGVRVHRARRGLLGAGIAAALLLIIGVTTSWALNRAMASRLLASAQAVRALPSIGAPGALPQVESLRQLDQLRIQLDTIQLYEQRGAPWTRRFFLWRGAELRKDALPVWYDGYKKQLYGASWGALVDSLKAQPLAPTPHEDSRPWHDRLKAFLITTHDPDRSTPEFLAPVLLKSWQRGIDAGDDELRELARRQFEFFAKELPHQRGWLQPYNQQLVLQTQQYLGRTSFGDRIYEFMLAEADRKLGPLRIRSAIPDVASVLQVPEEVPGSFTIEGAAVMSESFLHADQFQEEAWVVGDEAASQSKDVQQVVGTLRARYRSDYIDTWRGVVQRTTPIRLSGAGAVAEKLAKLGSGQSPTLGFFAIVSTQTTLDSAMLVAFQPVHRVIQPGVKNNYKTKENEEYVSGLLKLGTALESINGMSGSDSASATERARAAQAARSTSVTEAKNAARSITSEFSNDTSAIPLTGRVSQILLAPIEDADRELQAATKPWRSAPVRVAASGGGGGGTVPPPPSGGGAAAAAARLNDAGREFCRPMRSMLDKFPFNAESSTDATVQELTELLAPETGQLWTLQQRLAPFLAKQGNSWVAKDSGGVTISRTFLDFFTSAARLSEAFFPSGPQARVDVQVRGLTNDQVPQIKLTYGRDAVFKKDPASSNFTWSSNAAREARLFAQKKGKKEVLISSGTGEWALFRLISKAKITDAAGGTFNARWPASGKDGFDVVAEFSFVRGIPVMKPGALSMTCPAQVTP